MEKYLTYPAKDVPEPIDLIGKVSWVQTQRHRRNKDREVFEVFNTKTNKKVKCICSYFCPLKKGDVIVAKILRKDDYYIVTKPPFVQVGNDKESISIFFRKNLKGFGERKSERLYDEIELVAGSGKVDKYLSELAEVWMENEDSTILQEFAEYIDSANLGFLLTKWYHKFDKRRLWLLGLTNSEIRECLKICGSYYKIYEGCLNNPFKIYPIPEKKCMEILNRLRRQPEEDDVDCGRIIRRMYADMVHKSWTCTPVRFLAKDFKRLKELGPRLLSEYKVKKEFDCAYLQHSYMIEKYVSSYIEKLVRDDPVRDGSTEFVDFEEWDPFSYTNSRLEAEFRESATLSPDQRRAVQGALDHKISIIRGKPGSGKCLDPETGVLMFDGSIKKIKNILTGEQVMGPDSQPRNVLSICSGEDRMYKIIPSKGKPFVCNEPHVLTLKGESHTISVHKNRSMKYCANISVKGIRKHKYFYTMKEAKLFIESIPEDIFDISLAEFLERPYKQQEMCYIYHTGVDFVETPVPLDPYLIGLWLGKGYTDTEDIDNNHTIAKNKIIFDKLIPVLDEYCCKFTNESYPITSRLISKEIEYEKKYKTHVRNKMKELDLVENRHIPDIYKINSKNIRMRLLAGLLDAGGYYHCKYFEITQKSEVLANDIEYLAFSLGFMVTRDQVKKPCLYKGEKRHEIYYRLKIFGENIDEIPNFVEQIPSLGKTNKRRSTCLRFEIKEIGKGNYCGFELDGDGRFLLEDFTVTHNTSSVKEIVYNLRQRNVEYAICAFTGKAVARLRDVLDSTIPMTFHLKMKKQKSAKFQHLIVDEASMVTVELFYDFITRFGFPFNITLIGDPDQLPPIGWGSLFNECIKSETIPIYELVNNHRVYHVDGEEDGIISNTRRMSEHGKGLRGDQILTPMKFKPSNNFVISSGDTLQIAAFAKAFKSQGVKPEDVTVITPYNKDIASINTTFQKLYYEESDENEVESVFDSRGVRWYIGDRVMMTKNDYDINVMNGEEGVVIDVNAREIKVRFGYGREYDFPLEPDPRKRRWGTSYEKKDDDEEDAEDERTVKRLIHSYCVTVHRGQGSEWNYIIFYLPPGRSQPNYITKNLVYTGLTRAKRALFFIGNLKELEESTIRSLPFRCENLSRRLLEKLDVWDKPAPVDENAEDCFEEDFDL